MNDLLWKRHGIQPRSDQRKHLHAYVDAKVLDKVDEMVPPRQRSRFVETCLLNELKALEATSWGSHLTVQSWRSGQSKWLFIQCTRQGLVGTSGRRNIKLDSKDPVIFWNSHQLVPPPLFSCWILFLDVLVFTQVSCTSAVSSTNHYSMAMPWERRLWKSENSTSMKSKAH